jgi:hypothetical protein
VAWRGTGPFPATWSVGQSPDCHECVQRLCARRVRARVRARRRGSGVRARRVAASTTWTAAWASVCQQAAYDKGTDSALSQPVTTAPADAVLHFDGVFLLRPEVIDRWNLRIFVSAAFKETLDRARIRDQTLFRSATEVERRYRNRYIPSQQFYFDTARPTDHADIIVHNDEPQQPAWKARPR